MESPTRTITAVLCQTHARKPLVTIYGLPGYGAELKPQQLRALAECLMRIADDATAQPMGLRSYLQKKREYELTPNAGIQPSEHCEDRLE